MRFSTCHLIVLVCVAATLCLAVAEPVSAQGINLFDKNNNLPSRKEKTYSEQQLQILEGFRSVGDVEKRHSWSLFFSAGLTLLGAAAIICAILLWNRWQLKKAAWKLNDPMALVNELYFAHQLSPQEQRLMRDISDKQALSSPLQLFVEPKFLLEAWEDDSFAMSQPYVRRLLSKLFDININVGESSTIIGRTL